MYRQPSAVVESLIGLTPQSVSGSLVHGGIALIYVTAIVECEQALQLLRMPRPRVRATLGTLAYRSHFLVGELVQVFLSWSHPLIRDEQPVCEANMADVQILALLTTVLVSVLSSSM